MGDRETAIATFLADAGWRGADPVALAGDMSSRRYHRLRSAKGHTAILMETNGDPSTPAFLRMTRWLRDHGFSAPELFHVDEAGGLLLLEDLGDASLTRCIAENPSEADTYYSATLDLLVALRAAEPPDLPRPGARDLTDWTRIADDTLPCHDLSALEAFRAGLQDVLQTVLSEPATLSLRDLHADNLHWLPERKGVQRLGLLDYQDAFLTHPVYDLVSLLTDARTDVPRDRRARMIDAYVALTGDDPEDTHRAFAALSAQRNLRILAIFCRNTAKAPLIPRVWGYLREAASHPSLAPVRDDLLRAFPTLPGRSE